MPRWFGMVFDFGEDRSGGDNLFIEKAGVAHPVAGLYWCELVCVSIMVSATEPVVYC